MSEAAEKSNYFYGMKPEKSVYEGHGQRTAEGCCQYMLPALQHKAKEIADLKLLDIGCGPGSITVGLAKYMPQGHITGMDLSQTVLDKAEETAKQRGVTNITFQTGNIYELPFEDDTFDMIHTHQTICHCNEPVRAIKELARVTKKGGLLCMREADIHSARFWPESPLLEETFRLVAEVMKRTESGFSDAGRRLKAWTVEAEISRDNIVYTGGTFCYHTVEARGGFDGGRMLRGGPGDKAVEFGLTTRSHIDDIQKAWKEWEQDDDGVMMVLQGEVVVRV